MKIIFELKYPNFNNGRIEIQNNINNINSILWFGFLRKIAKVGGVKKVVQLYTRKSRCPGYYSLGQQNQFVGCQPSCQVIA